MFADIHWTILKSIDWERIDGIGRSLTPSSGPERLRIDLPDATLEITHPTAVIDYAYLAFDGLVAALVNMTDTLGRLLNRAYQLEIEKEKASLLAVRDRCAVSSMASMRRTSTGKARCFTRRRGRVSRTSTRW
jgi:hypothetical protein